jgi:hypothetical protein
MKDQSICGCAGKVVGGREKEEGGTEIAQKKFNFSLKRCDECQIGRDSEN